MFQNFSLELLIKNISGHNSTDKNCLERDSSVEVFFKALAYFVIFLVSLVGNLLVLMVIYSKKQLRKSINYFVFNMAVSDLFNPLTIMPIRIVEIISGSESWKVDSPRILGNILCKVSYFLPDVSLVVSIECLLLMSMDRLVAVVHPFKAKLISPKARIISIGCTWIIAIAVHAHYFYTFRLFLGSDNKTYCWQDWEPAFDHVETHSRYVTATFITFILVPICVLVIVYVKIAWTLKTKNKKIVQAFSSVRRSRRAQQLGKTVRMSVAIIIAFAVCMMPLLVLTFSLIFLWNWQVPPICIFHKVIPFIVTFMLHSCSAVNPFICLIFIRKYRRSLRRLFDK
ncbi:galanin receptor type 1-like [Oculina patagonica]